MGRRTRAETGSPCENDKRLFRKGTSAETHHNRVMGPLASYRKIDEAGHVRPSPRQSTFTGRRGCKPAFPSLYSKNPSRRSNRPMTATPARPDAAGSWPIGSPVRTIADLARDRQSRFGSFTLVARHRSQRNNFGFKLGTPPTHPKLLDWLALRFDRGRLETESRCTD